MLRGRHQGIRSLELVVELEMDNNATAVEPPRPYWILEGVRHDSPDDLFEAMADIARNAPLRTGELVTHGDIRLGRGVSEENWGRLARFVRLAGLKPRLVSASATK